MVEFFKALADDTRLHSVLLILAEGELCVCELVAALDYSQPKISRHLALLKQHQIVVDRKHKQWVFYRLNPALPAWCQDVLNSCLAHHNDYLALSLTRLQQLQSRPEKCC